jgi:hypothetical protein
VIKERQMFSAEYYEPWSYLKCRDFDTEEEMDAWVTVPSGVTVTQSGPSAWGWGVVVPHRRDRDAVRACLESSGRWWIAAEGSPQDAVGDELMLVLSLNHPESQEGARFASESDAEEAVCHLHGDGIFAGCVVARHRVWL